VSAKTPAYVPNLIDVGSMSADDREAWFCISSGQGQIETYEDFIRHNLDFEEVEDEGEADCEVYFTAEQIRGLASKAHMLSADVWDTIIDDEPTLRRLAREISTHDSASGGWVNETHLADGEARHPTDSREERLRG
jgi:hypothetical protein